MGRLNDELLKKALDGGFERVEKLFSIKIETEESLWLIGQAIFKCFNKLVSTPEGELSSEMFADTYLTCSMTILRIVWVQYPDLEVTEKLLVKLRNNIADTMSDIAKCYQGN